MFSKYKICKDLTQQEKNRHIISCTRFVPLVFLQLSCLSNARLKHSRSDLVFKAKQPRSLYDVIFGMLCWKELHRPTSQGIKYCSVDSFQWTIINNYEINSQYTVTFIVTFFCSIQLNSSSISFLKIPKSFSK